MYEKSTRDVAQTPDKFWNFNGAIRDNQKEVVNSFELIFKIYLINLFP